MITIQEIKKKANALYKEYLQSAINHQQFFPKCIRSNKKLSEDFLSMKEELSELISCSTDRKSYGYTIHYETINTRKHGTQNQPVAITFEKENDFLKFIGKEKEATLFKEELQIITSTFPQLLDWCANYPLSIIKNMGQWTDLLKVCNYFVIHPNPNLYIRELPIEVHTKFIEENETVLQSLLNVLIDKHILNKEEKIFENRFGLKSKPIQIRMRILDNEIAQQCFTGLTDISVTEEELKQLTIPCKNIYITENEMNFLTLPPLNNTISFFGKGFGISALSNIHWLSEKNIYYWGDMDVHGFQILSQLRSYFPHVLSIMMDMETYYTFEEFSVNNPVSNPPFLINLNEKEIELYNFLKENDKRLEQEKISYSYSIKNIIKSLNVN